MKKKKYFIAMSIFLLFLSPVLALDDTLNLEIPDTNYSETLKVGVNITIIDSDWQLKYFIKDSQCEATIGYVYDVNQTLLTNSNFIGDIATFNYSLINGNSYYFFVDNSGNPYNDRYILNGNFPKTSISLNATTGAYIFFGNFISDGVSRCLLNITTTKEEMITPITNYSFSYCSDDYTLTTNMIRNICIENDCLSLNRTQNITCQFGCDSNSNSCGIPDWIMYIIILFIISLALMIAYKVRR